MTAPADTKCFGDRLYLGDPPVHEKCLSCDHYRRRFDPVYILRPKLGWQDGQVHCPNWRPIELVSSAVL
jgi:hypothetical protein